MRHATENEGIEGFQVNFGCSKVVHESSQRIWGDTGRFVKIEIFGTVGIGSTQKGERNSLSLSLPLPARLWFTSPPGCQHE